MVLLAIAAGLWIRQFTGLTEYQPAVCLSNIKNITLAFQMYLADSDDTFPPAADWCDTLMAYVKNPAVYQCPQHAGDAACSYAYNASLERGDCAALADDTNTVVVFESDVGWNAIGGPELLPDDARHYVGDNYGFADGHAQWLRRAWRGPEDSEVWLKAVDGDVVWAPVWKDDAGPDGAKHGGPGTDGSSD
jgi:prepilin-type processing-associated H-X9-DG protein